MLDNADRLVAPSLLLYLCLWVMLLFAYLALRPEGWWLLTFAAVAVLLVLPVVILLWLKHRYEEGMRRGND